MQCVKPVKQDFLAGWLALAIVAIVGASAQPGRSVTSAVPTIVQRAADARAADMQGVVGMQRHFSTEIKGGPLHHSEQSDSAQLLIDGSSARIRYYGIVDDGHALSADQLAKREQQANQQWTEGKVFFKEPYDARYLSDYMFVQQPGCPCADGLVAVDFSSPIRDNQHGQGTMWIDPATARVQRLTYVPNALPPHATSGSVTEVSSEPLPHLWYVTRIEQHYGGHAFLFKGEGSFLGVFDHFRRFSNTNDGEVALQNNSL